MLHLLSRNRTTEGGSAAPATDHRSHLPHVLIASEGRAVSDRVIIRAADLLPGGQGRVTVLTVARLWGTSFGLPNPGLRPSKREMDEQKEIMTSALDRLEALGIEADGHIVTTRHPAKSIRRKLRKGSFDAIVMGADPRRPWFMRGFMWSQEPWRVKATMPVPVHLVCPDGSGPPPAPRRSLAAAG